MAILKHFSVHNRNYHAAVMYLMYEHDGHARPVYDEHGWLIERENLLIDCINTDLYTYAFDCAYTSRKYGKNWSDRDIDQPTIQGLKKEKASLLKEQERLNTQRKALKDCYQGLSEGYRAIEEQTRQQQRQHTQRRNRNGFDLG